MIQQILIHFSFLFFSPYLYRPSPSNSFNTFVLLNAFLYEKPLMPLTFNPITTYESIALVVKNAATSNPYVFLASGIRRTLNAKPFRGNFFVKMVVFKFISYIVSICDRYDRVQIM